MALPVFRAAGAKSAGTTGAVTVAAPAGVATGDLEILIAEVPTAATCSITNNGGGAWTAMTGSPITVAAGERLYVWSRIRAGGDGDPQVTASADHVCSARLAYQAGTFDTSDPFELETTSTETTSDTSFSWAPGGTTGGADRLVLVVSSILRDSNTASVPVCTNASLTSLASRANYCTNSGAGGGFGVTEGAKATAGTIGTFACTYGAASPKSYISFAIKPVGAQTLFGASSLTASVAITTDGRRTTFSSSSLGLSFAAVSSGVRVTFGASSLTLSMGVVSSGQAVARGSSSLTATVDITSVGRLGAMGASALALTVATVTTGTRTTFGSSTLPIGVAVETNGTRVTFGASSLALNVATTSVGHLGAFSTSTLAVAVSITSNGTVTGAGPTTHFGSSALTLTVATDTVGGSRETFGQSTLTLFTTTASAGTRETFSASTLGIVVAITTGGGGFVAATTGHIIFLPIGQVAGAKTGRIVA